MSTQQPMPLQEAFTEVSRSSSGGAPFLIAYGATFIITGILSYLLPDNIVALIALFQGGVALPVAFWLERRMGNGRMSAHNPLRALSGYMAGSQGLALGALIVAYNLSPRSIPVILAGLGGVHFMPYAWLHRTRLYVWLAVAVAVGAFVLQLVLGPPAFSIILLYVGVVYWLLAPAVYRHATRLAQQDAAPSLS